MKYFLDTEFHEDGRIIDLISLAITTEDSRQLYLISNEFNEEDCNDFVKENVLPNLGEGPRMTREEIREQVEIFIGHDKPEFWAYYGSYDWVLFCQLWGRMVDIPDHFPKRVCDLKQLEQMIPPAIRPPRPENQNEHNALADAMWNRSYYFGLWNTLRSNRFWKDLQL